MDDYKIKIYAGNDAQIERLRHVLDVSLDIIENYFTEPYDRLVQSRSYSTQQIAAAYISMGYYALRTIGHEQATSDLFDLLASCVKERTEENIQKAGKDPFNRRLT